MTTREIAELIENGYTIGIRSLEEDEEYQIGDSLRNSYDWNRDTDSSSYFDDEPVELPGTCAVFIGDPETVDSDEDVKTALNSALTESKKYDGNTKVIIAGFDGIPGDDYGEVIIPDAKVIAFL